MASFGKSALAFFGGTAEGAISKGLGGAKWGAIILGILGACIAGGTVLAFSGPVGVIAGVGLVGGAVSAGVGGWFGAQFGAAWGALTGGWKRLISVNQGEEAQLEHKLIQAQQNLNQAKQVRDTVLTRVSSEVQQSSGNPHRNADANEAQQPGQGGGTPVTKYQFNNHMANKDTAYFQNKENKRQTETSVSNYANL